MEPKSESKQSDQQQEIRACALRLLERREHTCLELSTKLAHKGFDSQNIAQVIECLERENLLSEARYIEDYIENRTRKGYGPKRIEMELCQKGLSDQDIQIGLSSVSTDWTENARQSYLKKYHKPVTSCQEKAKRMQYLYRRGYPNDLIQAVMKVCESED